MGLGALGLACPPRFPLREALRDGALMELLADGSIPSIPVTALFRTTPATPSRVKLFVGFVEQLFGECVAAGARPASAGA